MIYSMQRIWASTVKGRFNRKDPNLSLASLHESFTWFCKLPDTFYKFLHDACKILYAWKFDCCRELLQNFSMQRISAECSRHISTFTKFSVRHLKFSMNVSKYYVQSKFCHCDNLFISVIFHCLSWKISYATDVSNYVKIGTLAIPERTFAQRTKLSEKNTELKCWRLKSIVSPNLGCP